MKSRDFPPAKSYCLCREDVIICFSCLLNCRLGFNDANWLCGSLRFPNIVLFDVCLTV